MPRQVLDGGCRARRARVRGVSEHGWLVQQRFHFLPQSRVAGARHVQEGRACARILPASGVEDLLDLLQSFRGHSHRCASIHKAESGARNCHEAFLRNSLDIQALAKSQSRMTVSGDTFKTSAVSETVRPPKYRSSTTRPFLSSIAVSAFRASSTSMTLWPGSCETTSASSKGTISAPAPRFCERLARA